MIKKHFGRYSKKQKRNKFILKLVKGLFNLIAILFVSGVMMLAILNTFGLIKYVK